MLGSIKLFFKKPKPEAKGGKLDREEKRAERKSRERKLPSLEKRRRRHEGTEVAIRQGIKWWVG